jgi:hypothetical protein
MEQKNRRPKSLNPIFMDPPGVVVVLLLGLIEAGSSGPG